MVRTAFGTAQSGLGYGLRGRARIAVSAACGDAGYVAVDAVVALSIFASIIVFALVALHVSNRGAAAALEARQAREVLVAVLDTATTNPGVAEGGGSRFSWKLTVQAPAIVAGAITMCRQDAVATARSSGRAYRLTSARICPAGLGA